MNLIERVQEMECVINEKLRNNSISIKILANKNINKGTISIIKDEKVVRAYEIEVISSCQINIAENGKIIENGLFRDDLGKWIYNLYNPVEYLYAFYGNLLNGSILTEEQIYLITNGYTRSYEKERKSGALVPRKELDNQPKVEGYLGPMFEKIDYGKVFLRYETQEIYNMLST